MKSNIGTTDKSVRIILAAIILVLYFTNVISGTLATILLIVAAILLITAFFSFCPIWRLLGISTKKKKYINQREKLN